MEGGEGGAVVARDLERRGGEHQLGALGEDRPADPLRSLVEVVLQGAVGEVQVIAAGEAQDLADPAGFLAPAPAVGVAIVDPPPRRRRRR